MSRRETRRVGLSRCLILLMVAMTSNVAVADDGATTYQTLPGSTIRDYKAPSYVTKGNTTYQTLPGLSTRDSKVPAYISSGRQKQAAESLPDRRARAAPPAEGPANAA